MPLIGDLDVVTCLGTASTQSPHLLHLSPATPLVGF
jgi:hypothetical protein